MIPSLTSKTAYQRDNDKIIEYSYKNTLMHQEECGKRLGERHSEWLTEFHRKFGADVTR